MCYTGKCKYETYLGDCKIYDGIYPEDAACTENESDVDKIIELESRESSADEFPLLWDED